MNPTNYNTTKGITDIGVTNQSLNLRPAPHKKIYSSYCKPGKKSMLGNVIGPRGKLTITALQDGHSVKLPSESLYQHTNNIFSAFIIKAFLAVNSRKCID